MSKRSAEALECTDEVHKRVNGGCGNVWAFDPTKPGRIAVEEVVLDASDFEESIDYDCDRHDAGELDEDQDGENLVFGGNQMAQRIYEAYDPSKDIVKHGDASCFHRVMIDHISREPDCTDEDIYQVLFCLDM